jgi:hypothetical protein
MVEPKVKPEVKAKAKAKVRLRPMVEPKPSAGPYDPTRRRKNTTYRR